MNQSGPSGNGASGQKGPIVLLVESRVERDRLEQRENVLMSDVPILISLHGDLLEQASALAKTNRETARVLRQYLDFPSLMTMQTAGLNWHGFLNRQIEEKVLDLIGELGRIQKLSIEEM